MDETFGLPEPRFRRATPCVAGPRHVGSLPGRDVSTVSSRALDR